MRPFRIILEHPVYWALNRRNVTRAFALGLFLAFVPLPIHFVLGTIAALLLRLNVPAVLAGTLLTNPFTFVPLYGTAYWIGARLLDVPERHVQFEMSWQWLASELLPIWKPFLLGCAVMGLLSAMVGYLVLGGLWQLSLLLKYHRRKGTGAEKESAGGEKLE